MKIKVPFEQRNEYIDRAEAIISDIKAARAKEDKLVETEFKAWHEKAMKRWIFRPDIHGPTAEWAWSHLMTLWYPSQKYSEQYERLLQIIRVLKSDAEEVFLEEKDIRCLQL